MSSLTRSTTATTSSALDPNTPTTPKKPRKKFTIPLGVVLLVFLLITVTVVGVLSWYLTFSVSQDSIQKLSKNVAEKSQKAIEADLQLRLDVIERQVSAHKNRWEAGLVSVANKRDAASEIHPLFSGFSDFVATATFTTKIGELWGWGLNFDPSTGDPIYIKWEHEGLAFKEYQASSTGTTVRIRDQSSNYNATSGEWVSGLDKTDPTAELWTTPYMWLERAWVTYSRPAFQDGDFEVVVAGDLEVSFLSSILRNVTRESQDELPISIYVFSASDSSLLASSVNGTELFKKSNVTGARLRPLYLSESEDRYISGFNTFLDGKRLTDLHDEIGANQAITQTLNIDARNYFASIRAFKHGGIEWIVLQYLDENSILEEVYNRTYITAVVAASVTATSILVALAFVLVLSKQLKSLYNDIQALSEFKFSEVLSSKSDSGGGGGSGSSSGGIRNESWVLELNRIQVAFQNLVKTFAESIDKRNKMMGKARPGSSSAGGPTVNTSPRQSLPYSDTQSLVSPFSPTAETTSPRHPTSPSTPRKSVVDEDDDLYV